LIHPDRKRGFLLPIMGTCEETWGKVLLHVSFFNHLGIVGKAI
jgi:hypothetical protein